MPTITVTNLGGPLTRRKDGNIDSGLANFDTSWGYNPYVEPGNLTWMEQPTSILNLLGNSSIISVMKPRVNNDTGYVHAIAANGNLYNIQVNNTGTNEANFDTPSLVGALFSTPNTLRSAGMVFYGTTEKIFYGDDTTLQKINFDGSSPTSIITTSSMTGSIPRPMTVFQGKIYYGNGTNIGEIDTTETITTGTKLSPSLLAGTVVRDLDVTPDGNYLLITSSRGSPNGGFNLLTATPAASTDSYKFLWNGTDLGATAFEEYEGICFTANETFGNKNYTLGFDSQGAAIYQGEDKIVSLPKNISPHPTATFSIGNMLGFLNPEFSDGIYKGSLYNYGQYDDEFPKGLFRLLRQTPAIQTDINFVNTCTNISNLLYFPSHSSYANDLASSGKIYFSTLESNGTGNANRGLLWKFFTTPTGINSILAGVYETQTQLFSKKIKVKEVRLYTNPLTTDNAFSIDLIGSGGSVLSGGSQNFRAGASVGGTVNVVNGEDLVKYNPATAPTYALGVRITNSSVTGVRNWSASKLEIDWEPAGK